MKQTIAIIAAFLLLLCAVGCSQNETAPSLTAEEESQYHAIDQYLVTVDGQQYLILPVSQEHIRLSNTLLPYLAQIDLALLTATEEKNHRPSHGPFSASPILDPVGGRTVIPVWRVHRVLSRCHRSGLWARPRTFLPV